MRPSTDRGGLQLWIFLPLSLIALAFLLGRSLYDMECGTSFACLGSVLVLLILLCLAALPLDEQVHSPNHPWPLLFQILILLGACGAEAMLWSRGPQKTALMLPGYALGFLAAAGEIYLLQGLGPERRARSFSKKVEMGRGLEILGLTVVMLLALLLRLYRLGDLPTTWWFDEVNLARATQDHILVYHETPLYVGEAIENPGMYLWIAALVFKVFGVGIVPLRYLSAFFGWLALWPFYFLGRRLLGRPWGLAALAIFALMRWTLVPEHIAFMSGFALFWSLTAIYFFWIFLEKPKSWRALAAGLAAGFTLHSYTPSRLVLPLLGLLLLAQYFRRGWPPLKSLLLFALGFGIVGGPMLYYIATHWSDYILRAQQVSIWGDVQSKGWNELWTSFTRHLECFNFRGDYNARHNLSLWPQLDFLSGALFLLALPLAHFRLFKDPVAFLLVLWFWIMLSAGIFSITVEAPQAHRAILVAPVCALLDAWLLADLSGRLEAAWGRPWPLALRLALLACLAFIPLFNVTELYANWPDDAATWRSFSPEASLVAQRALRSPPDEEIFLSSLKHEYGYNGYERAFFLNFFLRQVGRSYRSLEGSVEVSPGAGGALLLYGSSDLEIDEALHREFPKGRFEIAKDPHGGADDYCALELRREEIPLWKPGKSPAPLLFRR